MRKKDYGGINILHQSSFIKSMGMSCLMGKTIIDVSTYGKKKLNTNKVDTECFWVENLEKVITKINSFFEVLEI